MNTVFDIRIDFTKSHGSYVFDKNTNNEFLDMFCMFSSLPLGYNHPVFDDTFDERVKFISRLRMCNNLFESDELIEFTASLKEIGNHENIHFCSTGALAVESALKCAFEFKKDPTARVLGIKNSYHGINGWGYMTDPEISSVKNRVLHFPTNHWEHHTIDGLINYIKNNGDVAAVIVEPIQCTAGDIYLDPEKLKELQELCNENDICFIIDEVQTGFGVTGQMWYSDKVGLSPDILIFGKKSQICGIMVNDKYSEAIKSQYRKLQVTFDGDLLDVIRAQYILKAIQEYDLMNAVKANSIIFRKELSSLFSNYRSSGHLIAFDFGDQRERDDFVRGAYANNLLVNPTNDKSVRLRPNMAISHSEMDAFFEKIAKAIK